MNRGEGESLDAAAPARSWRCGGRTTRRRTPGYWSGAPCAVAGENEIFLAYRLRRPIGQGRGYAVAVARSADGERFDTLLTIGKEDMAADSLERPALVRTPEGRWRLYLSCATRAPSTGGWR